MGGQVGPIIMGQKNGKPYLGPSEARDIADASGMTVDEVRYRFEDFCAEFPSGQMKPEHMKKLLGKALPKQAVNKMEKYVFRIFDADGDGMIDFSEFLPIFFLGYGSINQFDKDCETYLRKMFNVFDTENKGWVGENELVQLVQDMAKYALPGKPATEVSEEAIKTAFNQVDLDSDGKLTVEEFISVCNGGEPNIITELVSSLTFLLEDIGLKPTDQDYVHG